MLFSYYTIGQRIKELRVARNMSQALLSEKVGLSPTYISYIESGMKCMSLETLLKIANALDVTADTILADCFDNHSSISKHEFIDILGKERMKYYVVSDIHGYYTELKQALDEKGFFSDTIPHKLIVCGDVLDRGSEAKEVQQFILDLMDKNEVVLIRGNHEDLMMDLLYGWDKKSYLLSHHRSNKTVDTVLQLTDSHYILDDNKDEVKEKLSNTPFIQKIIPAMINYYETNKYIFVHGWIPCNRFRENRYYDRFEAIDDWRNACPEDWYFARWTNGMEAWNGGVKEQGKTIVCGHWNCSYGHSVLEHKGSQYDEDADHSPFYGDGIIAIDACTPLSNKINCLVLEDNN